MSIEMEGTIGKTRKKNNNFEVIKLQQNGIKKHIENFSSATVSSFDSESGSSSMERDIKCEKKIHKKMIRSTLDLNQLSNNPISQNCGIVVKNKEKRTKKKKRVYDLPKINNVAEDLSGSIENISPIPNLSGDTRKKKIKNRKSQKSNSDWSEWSISDSSDNINEKGRREKVGNKWSTGETQRTSSNMSDPDSEIEFNRKNCKAAKLNNNVKLQDMRKSKGDTNYARRIKQLLASDYNSLNCHHASLQNEKDVPQNELGTDEYSGALDIGKRYITRSTTKEKLKRKTSRTTNRQTKSLSENLFVLPDISINDQKQITHLLSIVNETDKTISTSEKKKGKLLSNLPDNGKEKQSSINLDHSSHRISMGKYKGDKSSNDASLAISFNETIDDYIETMGTDDVFNIPDMKANNRRETYCLSEATNSSLILESGTDGKNRKSVRFYKDSTDKSPQCLTTSYYSDSEDIPSLTPDKSGNNSGTFEINTTAELSQPLKNISPSEKCLFGNSFNKSQKENIAQKKIKEAKTKSTSESFRSPKCIRTPAKFSFNSSTNNEIKTPFNQVAENVTLNNSNKKTQNSSKLSIEDSTNFNGNTLEFSQISLKNEQSIIDLVTPSPSRKCIDSSCISSGKSSHKEINKHNREATFIKEIGVTEDKMDILSIVKQHKNKSASILNIAQDSMTTQENLNRTVSPSKAPILSKKRGTFTKEESETPQLDMNSTYSMALNETDKKNIDTSKVNKRRRWDKSLIGVGLLDSSSDIVNFSPPWKNGFDVFETTNTRNKSLSTYKTVTEVPATTADIVSSTPPSCTSTPLPKCGTKYFCKSVLNDSSRNVGVKDSKSLSKDIVKPAKTVRSRIPNFALIHQRAFDKLESLKEMSERKAARAKLLMSGHRPIKENIPKIVSSSKRRELQYNSPAKLTPLVAGKFSENIIPNKNISLSKIKNSCPSKSNPKILNKENNLAPIEKKAQQLLKSRIPKTNILVAKRKSFTRFGFKTGPESVKTATKDEQVKAITSKIKITKNTIDERRNVVQGVRSNRRFELLMAMRNKCETKK